MTRREIREFIKTGVNDMLPSIEFGSGRLSEFASIRSHKYPSIWFLLGEVGGTNNPSGAPVDNWEIKLIIAQKDSADSKAEQYEEIIDACDEIAQKLIYKYNVTVEGYKLMRIENRNRVPFVKDNSPDCITGVELSFTIVTPDQTNVC
jgi:hypothetical protein